MHVCILSPVKMFSRIVRKCLCVRASACDSVRCAINKYANFQLGSR